MSGHHDQDETTVSFAGRGVSAEHAQTIWALGSVSAMPDAPEPRFLKLEDVAEELNMSKNQIYALVRQGELSAVKIGGRGQWRVERDKLEQYIDRLYSETQQFIKDHPYDEPASEAEPDLSTERGRTTDLAGAAGPLLPEAAGQSDRQQDLGGLETI